MISEIEGLFQELQQLNNNLKKSINKNIISSTLLKKKTLSNDVTLTRLKTLKQKNNDIQGFTKDVDSLCGLLANAYIREQISADVAKTMAKKLPSPLYPMYQKRKRPK